MLTQIDRKTVVNRYTAVQVKVREAANNEPEELTTATLNEIASLTHNRYSWKANESNKILVIPFPTLWTFWTDD